MVWIRPGSFRLGSDPDEIGHGPDEDPATEVRITHGFWMGLREVTQAEYREVMGVNPSAYQGGTDLPVEKVTWNEAVAYCAKRTLFEREADRLPTGFGYRLPTEAEWEYACRADTTTRYHFGDDLAGTELAAHGWFINNSGSSTHPVGQLKPNAWGLYDMHGNVWEWVQDWYAKYPPGPLTDPQGPSSGALRVIRGGGWFVGAGLCRSAYRHCAGPGRRLLYLGFRVLRTAS
jgi:formylglycine-generating enzyme required for sulfatase activity